MDGRGAQLLVVRPQLGARPRHTFYAPSHTLNALTPRSPFTPVTLPCYAKGFSIPAAKLKPGVIAVNISQFQNFGDGVAELGTYVPAVGKVTIAMLERNLLRLHANFHASKGASSSYAKLWGVAAALTLGLVVAVGRRRGATM